MVVLAQHPATPKRKQSIHTYIAKYHRHGVGSWSHHHQKLSQRWMIMEEEVKNLVFKVFMSPNLRLITGFLLVKTYKMMFIFWLIKWRYRAETAQQFLTMVAWDMHSFWFVTGRKVFQSMKNTDCGVLLWRTCLGSTAFVSICRDRNTLKWVYIYYSMLKVSKVADFLVTEESRTEQKGGSVSVVEECRPADTKEWTCVLGGVKFFTRWLVRSHLQQQRSGASSSPSERGCCLLQEGWRPQPPMSSFLHRNPPHMAAQCGNLNTLFIILENTASLWANLCLLLKWSKASGW